jgi:hypothetical protein
VNDAQLSLFDEQASARSLNGHADDDGDLLDAVRRLVAEPGMAEDEVRAVVQDALAEMKWAPAAPLRAQPCRCTRTLMLPGSTCLWCGRSPSAPGGAHYREPVEWEGRRWSEVGVLKMQCPRGHELTPANTRTDRDGRRVCRTCDREGSRRRRAARRGA